jgi:hypothetical protein
MSAVSIRSSTRRDLNVKTRGLSTGPCCTTPALIEGVVLPSIMSTAVYTALAPNRLKDFWRD